MFNIGQKIKELRRKNDLTQEKLADSLGVSYQAVSKWETGVSSPDLSLIVPLARLLGVTTDELLGASEEGKRLEEYERLYKDTFRTGDITERLRITESAVKELPSNMKWLNHYAWAHWCNALDTIPNGEAFEAEREKAIKLFDKVIGNTDDDEIKAHAITGIVGCLCGKGCKAEARRYVEMYPDSKVSSAEKDRLLGGCLEGDEQIRHKQTYLGKHLDELVDILLWNNIGDNQYTCAAAECIINAMIPDGNYCTYHHQMSHIHFRKAAMAVTRGDCEEAMKYLQKSVYHAKEYDRIDLIHPGKYAYTAPLFDHLVIDSKEWCRTGTGSLLDDIKDLCKRTKNVFDSLHDRDDFQALLKTK